MIHLNNRFPGNNKVGIMAFLITFTISFIATAIIFSSSDNEATKEPEKVIGCEEAESTISNLDDIETLPDNLGKLQLGLIYNPDFLLQTEDVEDETSVNLEQEFVEIETTTQEYTRPNKLYYVQDGIYRFDLAIEYQDYLYEMCVKYDIEEYYTLLIAQMYHESKFRADAISQTNDYGLMQINKGNHEWLGGMLGNYDFLDPYNNIEAGVYMMSYGLKKYNDVHKALVCYNSGEGEVINGVYSTRYSYGVIADIDKLIELK